MVLVLVMIPNGQTCPRWNRMDPKVTEFPFLRTVWAGLAETLEGRLEHQMSG